MSFHPNEMHRRAMGATVMIAGMLLFLTGGFFRSQVLQHQKYALQAETNRLRELPLPAPRGVIYDRNHKIIADNVIGYSVSLLAPKEDSLRVALAQLAQAVNMTPGQVDQALRRFRRSPGRPAVVIPDASFDVVSVLEEHRTQFPGLIIQSAPRRFYPDGEIVAPFVGYIGEISETELARLKDTADYKAGQQIGKQGLEKEYENVLHGKEGSQFVEIDARGRIVHETGARPDLAPVAADSLQTNIDMDLQRVAASLFGDTLQGGVVALDPKTGGVLALYSAPSWDANRFVGGIPAQYWDSLRADPRRPLYNKALQGEYPPGSTFKIATAVTALELGVVRMDEHMPVTCTGGLQYGSRYFHCDGKHGSLSLAEAIAKSCNTYFYQLGIKLGLTRLLAGGVDLGISRERRDRPARRATSAVAGDGRVFQSAVRQARLDVVGRAQPGDRPGRERADDPQHGAVLYRARHRRDGGAAGSRAHRAGAQEDLQSDRRAVQGSAGGTGQRRRDGNGGARADQGRGARGQDGHGTEPQVRQERQGAQLLLVRRLRAGRRSRRSSSR